MFYIIINESYVITKNIGKTIKHHKKFDIKNYLISPSSQRGNLFLCLLL